MIQDVPFDGVDAPLNFSLFLNLLVPVFFKGKPPGLDLFPCQSVCFLTHEEVAELVHASLREFYALLEMGQLFLSQVEHTLNFLGQARDLAVQSLFDHLLLLADLVEDFLNKVVRDEVLLPVEARRVVTHALLLPNDDRLGVRE